jgi:hypothetical protein
MTRFKFIGAALALSAFIATAASAQVGEPAAAAALDPNFSIYASPGRPDGYSRSIVAQPYDANAMAEPRMSVTPHRTHRAPVR